MLRRAGSQRETPVVVEDRPQLVRDQIDPKDLQTATGDDCISDWARRNVGSSHIGKRLFQSGPKQSDPKCQKGKTKAAAI
jgi:hypothetical protein